MTVPDPLDACAAVDTCSLSAAHCRADGECRCVTLPDMKKTTTGVSAAVPDQDEAWFRTDLGRYGGPCISPSLLSWTD
jgi:hypothetical protein